MAREDHGTVTVPRTRARAGYRKVRLARDRTGPIGRPYRGLEPGGRVAWWGGVAPTAWLRTRHGWVGTRRAQARYREEY